MDFLKGFNEFNKIIRRINESVASDSSDSYLIVYDENIEGGSKELADKYASDLISIQSDSKVSQLADQLISKGETVLSHWENAWEKRRSSGVDEGELRKEGEWYVGKGAWRINSNKALKLGMKPDWMEWNDPLHNEIIDNFFPELNKASSKEDNLGDVDLDNIDLPDWINNPEEELVLAESKDLKYIKRLYEDEEGDTRGQVAPPRAASTNVSVYTPQMLEDRLVKIFNSRGRYMPMIWGAPGIGKTAIVRDVAKKIAAQKGLKQGLPVMVVTLANFTPTDLGGVPLLFHTGAVAKVDKYMETPEGESEQVEQFAGSDKVILPADMRGKVSQEQTIPGWLPGESDPDEGILFFDEINRAPEEMLGASLTLLLDRQTASGRYTMPWGWRVFAAGNRRMDGPVTPLEGAVASRFTAGHLHLVPTIQNWIDKVARHPKNGMMKDGPYESEMFLIDGVSQYFIPDEFLVYLKTMDSTTDAPEYFDMEGKPIKTDFKVFYYLDKADAEEGEGGRAESTSP